LFKKTKIFQWPKQTVALHARGEKRKEQVGKKRTKGTHLAENPARFDETKVLKSG